MGFGKKTDFASGRLLDLDATYEAIIQPAVRNSDLRCIRADEIVHSGVIDTEMYEMLLRADLVIADISTANVNAIYELGIRHALRPNSTIIIKEDKGNFHFDLDHISTFQYEHLGTDIGYREVRRARGDLEKLIEQSLKAKKPDSPVYTFLPSLQSPSLSSEEFEELVDEVEAEQANLAQIMARAENASEDSQHEKAAQFYLEADKLRPNEPFILQQLALATYKSELPSKIRALKRGLEIISALDIENSNDPETQGITGAIFKRLWLETKDPQKLEAAITHYRRGYEFRRDYYNGENLATCYDFRSEIQKAPDEVQYDQMSAKKVRERIIDELTYELEQPSFDQRSDRHWVYATLANCFYALGDDEKGLGFESNFREENVADWELETFEESKKYVRQL
jgi:tetratricopeptide (TPR) repeat protein